MLLTYYPSGHVSRVLHVITSYVTDDITCRPDLPVSYKNGSEITCKLVTLVLKMTSELY